MSKKSIILKIEIEYFFTASIRTLDFNINTTSLSWWLLHQ